MKQWFRYDSAPVYLMTVSLFAGFLNLRIRSEKLSRAICAVAPMTLGVYLIHAHANVSPWLWGTLALPEKMMLALFPMIQMGTVIGIFLLCVGIDALRKVTVGRMERSGWLIRNCTAASEGVQTMIAQLIKKF